MNALDVETAKVAASAATSEKAVVEDLVAGLGEGPFSAVLFFASPRFAMAELASAMHEAFPDTLTVGCTTMGELGPLGVRSGSVVAMGLAPWCRVAALPIDLRAFRFEDGGRIVTELLSRVRDEPAGLHPRKHVFITLTDGLSGKEELLVASLGTHAPGVPLVGGSAADDFRFERTWVALDGHAFPEAAVVMLLEPTVPFHTFHLHHFHPCDQRVVVTAADPGRRLVREIDGRPAVEVMARLMDTTPERLREQQVPARSDGQVSLAFRVGERYFLRTVMRIYDDMLWMGGAVEEGSILHVMRRGDLVRSTREGVEAALDAVGGGQGLLLFNCGGRLLEAEEAGVVEDLWEAMTPRGVAAAGFTTYGEQYGPVQVSSTLTGLALGPRGRQHG